MKNKHIAFITGMICMLGGLLQAQTAEIMPSPQTNAAAISVVVVYDGSGSMGDKVADEGGKKTSKYLIANKALVDIANKLDEFARTRQTNIEMGLVVFQDSKVRTDISLRPLDVAPFADWARKFKRPAGGTPLGDGIRKASELLAKSQSAKKHILVITDGESNVGTSPDYVIKYMQDMEMKIPVYFVAFDVDAHVFDPVKKLGATVVSASNGEQLRVQLDTIVGKKILLEAE